MSEPQTDSDRAREAHAMQDAMMSSFCRSGNINVPWLNPRPVKPEAEMPTQPAGVQAPPVVLGLP
jgi:hypothetical protein